MIRVDKETKVQLEAAAASRDDADDDDLPTLSQSMRIDAPTPATAEQMAAEKRKEAAEAKAMAEAKAKAEARAKAEAKARAEEKARAKAKAEAQAKAEAKARAEAEAKAQAKAKAEARAKAEAKAKAEARAKAEAQARKKADMPRMPDIDVLEAAIAAANESEEKKKPEPKPAGSDGPDRTDKTLDGVPALTLDAALKEKPAKAQSIAQETADGLGKAESLRDLTESMAETLFGNAEFEAIAAEVASTAQKANVDNAKPEPAEAPAKKPGADAAALAEAAERDPSLVLELVEDPIPGNPGDTPAADKDIQMSTTRRLDLVKKLNSSGSPEKVEKGDSREPKPAQQQKKTDEPASLEEQFQSEMTATLKAIDVVDTPTGDADDEPKKKTGLLSRFSRSS